MRVRASLRWTETDDSELAALITWISQEGEYAKDEDRLHDWPGHTQSRNAQAAHQQVRTSCARDAGFFEETCPLWQNLRARLSTLLTISPGYALLSDWQRVIPCWRDGRVV